MSVRISVVTLLVVAVVAGSLLHITSPQVQAAPPEPEIAGESAIVIDAETGAILYDMNSRERLAPASLTKIFTAYYAIDASPLQRRMSVVKDDLVGEASAGLNAGDDLSLETLLHGLMLASGNDAAMTIARNIGQSHAPAGLDGVSSFTSYVNAQLASLGLTDTSIANPHGLDQSGHYSTAHDIAAITMLAMQSEPDFLRILSSPGYAGDGMAFEQRNQLLGNYPGAIGGKTGITDNAGYCLMSIAHRDGRTLISIVLGSTVDAWYSDSMTLLDYGFETPVTGAEPAVTLSTEPSTSMVAGTAASIQGLALQSAGLDAVSVRPDVAASIGSWNVLRWPIGAVLGMAVALIVAVQARALVELQQRPMAGRMRPRRARPRRAPSPARQAQPVPQTYQQPGETQPFATVRGWDMPIPSWTPGVGD